MIESVMAIEYNVFGFEEEIKSNERLYLMIVNKQAPALTGAR